MKGYKPKEQEMRALVLLAWLMAVCSVTSVGLLFAILLAVS